MRPSGSAPASAAIALAPLPPWRLSTTKVLLMILERCGTISRRNTSLPPPGLEWVTSVTTATDSLLRSHAIENVPSASVQRQIFHDIMPGESGTVSDHRQESR